MSEGLASLELLPRKEFIITLRNGEKLPGKFGSWAMRRFCDKKGNIGLVDMMDKFFKPLNNPDGTPRLDDKGEELFDIMVGDMVDYILCAIEYAARKANAKFTLTDVQLCDYFDDYADDTGENGIMIKIYKHSAGEQKKSEDPLPKTETSS